MQTKLKSAILTFSLGGAALLFQNIANADVVDDAYRLCSALERTGLTTECEVKGWGSTVDVRIATSGSEARKICSGVVDMMANQTGSFNGNWKLQIFSPYSGDHPIASCTLR
jgi:hypothetical protein